MIVQINTFLLIIVIITASCSNKRSSNAKTETFKVWGNCGMCEKTIEESIDVDGVFSAVWNKETKLIEVVYDSTKINLDQIQKNIAASGYDNDGYQGDNEAYNNRPDCCKYERKQN